MTKRGGIATAGVARFAMTMGGGRGGGLGGEVGFVAEDVGLKVGVGNAADDDEFADEDFRCDGEVFCPRGHNDRDVCNHVEIDRVFRLVDTHAFKGGKKVARNAADGDNAEGDTRA